MNCSWHSFQGYGQSQALPSLQGHFIPMEGMFLVILHVLIDFIFYTPKVIEYPFILKEYLPEAGNAL
jgi:hypothetical protein